ncbi:MAG: NERD domain-containing protein [Muribaculaceae bacterium]|nr:NERD domain-containing protein [Muribaculaceae bacterium]
MDIRLLCGIMLGIAICLAVFVAIFKWRSLRNVRKGRRGEKVVSKELHRLSDRDTIVFNDLLLPTPSGRSSQIDHLVISRRGIFVIETKSLAGRISGSEHAQYWTQHFSSGTRQFYNPLLQNRSHIRALRSILPDLAEDDFVSVVVFTEAWRLDLRADDIVKPRRLLPDLHIRRTFIPAERRKRRWWRPGREVRLDERKLVLPVDEIVKEIRGRPKILTIEKIQEAVEIISRNSMHGRKCMNEHTSYARQTARNISREIRQGNCPRCGGRLVVRRGENGEFVGCENYPDCRFTCSIDRLK